MPNNLIPSASQDGPSWAEAPFLARLTGSYTVVENDGYNMPIGTILYFFAEQTYNPSTGAPGDMLGGRQTVTEIIDFKPYPISGWAIEDNNSTITIPGSTPPGTENPGPYVEMRLKGLVLGMPVYEFQLTLPSLAFVQVTQSTPSTIYLGRSVTDATLVAGSNVLSSASANFTSADVRSVVVSGPQGSPDGAIPANTTIASVISGSTAVMSANATANKTNEIVAISYRQYLGYPAVAGAFAEDSSAGEFYSLSTVAWLLSPNAPDPNNTNIPAYHANWPLPFEGYPPFYGAPAATDAYGLTIYIWAHDPAAFYDFAPPDFPSGGGLGHIAEYGLSQGAVLTCGPNFLLSGKLTDQGTVGGGDFFMSPGPSSNSIAPQAYMGDTGADGVGNQFLNGVNVSIGGSNFTGTVNGGSFWPS